MSDQVTLGDVLLDIQAGKSFQTTEILARPNELGVLKVSAVTWSDFQPDEAKALNGEYVPNVSHRVRQGDLLISRANTKEFVGAVVLVDRDYPFRLLSDKTLRLVIDEDRASKEYLLFALRSPKARRHIEHYATGTSDSMRNIAQGVITSVPIDLPALSTQRRIAARLTAQMGEVDAARSAALAQAQAIALLRRRVLAEVFAAAEDAPRKRIGEHANTTSGVTPARGNAEYWIPAEVPWIKTGEIDFMPIWKVREHISRKALSDCSLAVLPAKSVLVAITGEGKTRGRSAVLEIAAANNQHSVAILPNDTWEPEFLQLWLQRSYQELRQISEGRGGSRSALSGEQIKSLAIPAPRRSEQIAITKRAQVALRDVETLLAANHAQCAELERLPQRLLAQAFER